MVVTRSASSSKQLQNTIDSVLKNVTNLDDSSEILVSNICSEVNKIKYNYPDTDIGQLEPSIAQLIFCFDDAVARNVTIASLADDCRSQIVVLEDRLRDERGRRTTDYNDSLCEQELLLNERDSLLTENSNLKSSLNNLKYTLKNIQDEMELLRCRLTEKDSIISDLNLQIGQYKLLSRNLTDTNEKLQGQLKLTEERSWLASRWLDDNILDSYFLAFSENTNSLISKAIFFGPSLTEIVKHGEPNDVATLLKNKLFHFSNYAFFCINNNTHCDKQDSGSHWSLLFLDLTKKEAFHLDSLNELNHASALQVLCKLNCNITDLTELECTQQRNDFECGLSVLTYAKLITGSFCSNALSNKFPFLIWYYSLFYCSNLNHTECIFKQTEQTTERDCDSVKIDKMTVPGQHNLDSSKKCERSTSPCLTGEITSSPPENSEIAVSSKNNQPSKPFRIRKNLIVNKSKGKQIKTKLKKDKLTKSNCVNRFDILSKLNDDALNINCTIPVTCTKTDKLGNDKSNKTVKKREISNKRKVKNCVYKNSVFDTKITARVDNTSDAQSGSLESVYTVATGVQPTVRMFTDSHGRNLPSLLTFNQSKFTVRGHTIPNGKTSHVLRAAGSELKELGENDYMLIMSGTNDLGFGNENCIIDQVEGFLQKPADCSIFLVGIPYRHDAVSFNKSITSINTKLEQLCLKYAHATFLSISHLSRGLFTMHGLHLNIKGKRVLAELINRTLLSHTLPRTHFTLKTNVSNHKKFQRSQFLALRSTEKIRQRIYPPIVNQHERQSSNREPAVFSRQFVNSATPFLELLLPVQSLG